MSHGDRGLPEIVLIRSSLRPGDSARFVDSVLDGKGQIPPWRGALAEEEIETIWAYIRATVDH